MKKEIKSCGDAQDELREHLKNSYGDDITADEIEDQTDSWCRVCNYSCGKNAPMDDKIKSCLIAKRAVKTTGHRKPIDQIDPTPLQS